MYPNFLASQRGWSRLRYYRYKFFQTLMDCADWVFWKLDRQARYDWIDCQCGQMDDYVHVDAL